MSIYCDANKTTLMPPTVIDTMIKWSNRGDPSSQYASGKEAKQLIDKFCKYIANVGDFTLDGPEGYTIYFTNGASMANNNIITASVRSFANKTKLQPHIITSAVEHKSILECCIQLSREKLCQLTIISVDETDKLRGTVNIQSIQNAIKKNTCLITIMAANHETGSINNLQEISKIARHYRIPFHSDIAQLYGKSIFRPRQLNIDAFSVSFHKLHGPPGIGFLCVKNMFIEGYNLIFPQNGIENIPAIAASFAAMKYTLKNRGVKNTLLRQFTTDIISSLPSTVMILNPTEYCKTLPNTLLILVNYKILRGPLEKLNIIVNDLVDQHVLDAINIPRELHPNVLRLSFTDDTTPLEAARLKQELLLLLRN
jgi:cysteine desulfurase